MVASRPNDHRRKDSIRGFARHRSMFRYHRTDKYQLRLAARNRRLHFHPSVLGNDAVFFLLKRSDSRPKGILTSRH